MFFLNISSLLNVFQVRWADVEEKMQQKKIRDLGFVVGQTNWSRMTQRSENQLLRKPSIFDE